MIMNSMVLAVKVKGCMHNRHLHRLYLSYTYVYIIYLVIVNNNVVEIVS